MHPRSPVSTTLLPCLAALVFALPETALAQDGPETDIWSTTPPADPEVGLVSDEPFDTPADPPAVSSPSASATSAVPSQEIGDAYAASPEGAPAEQPVEAEVDSLEASREATTRTLASSDRPPPPTFTFWEDATDGGFIKPVLEMSALGVGYFPSSEANDELAVRVSTLALVRFGLEGRLFDLITFRSVFERNLGFSLARNGPVGTSVWEGTASLQARENYLQISKYGFALTGGILRDPASVDYISVNVLDAFGMDPYVRDPLLVTGFSQGQGVMASYTLGPVTGRVSFTGGNPLTTSLAFGFGGDVDTLGTLFTAPLRTFTTGVPGSDIHVNLLNPSITYESELLDVKAGAQLYFVDVNVTSDEDENLQGYNFRGTAQLKLMDEQIRLHGSFAFRQNEQLDIPDPTTRKRRYQGITGGFGADFSYGDFSIGGTYYLLNQNYAQGNEVDTEYINLGGTYWFVPGHVSVGLRYARSMVKRVPEDPPPPLESTDSLILSLRLLI